MKGSKPLTLPCSGSFRETQNSKEKRLSRWEDSWWHNKVSQGKSLSSLSSLLSNAGVRPVKVEWQPISNGSPMARQSLASTVLRLNIVSSRPLATNLLAEEHCPIKSNIDYYRLQEELVERGVYSKFSRKLCNSPSKKASLAEFAGELRCIWWLDHDLVQIAKDSFPEIGDSFDFLWNIVRPLLNEWRDTKLTNDSNSLWYDTHHNIGRGYRIKQRCAQWSARTLENAMQECAVI